MKRILISLLGIPAAYLAVAFLAATLNPFDWTQFGRLLCLVLAFFSFHAINDLDYWSRK